MNTIVLAIDYGEKRIGLAISDENAKLALPYEVIENKGLNFIVEQIGKVVKEEEVNKIVVGLPKGLNGQERRPTDRHGDKTELDKFIDKLKKVIGLPVVLFDERMTSKAADKFKLDKDKKETGWRDKIAASIILQDYIDSQKVKSP